MRNKFFRGRRLRRTPNLRALARETNVVSSDLVYPFFVIEGNRLKVPIESMEGIDRLSPDLVIQEAETVMKKGVNAVLLFGVVEKRDLKGSEAFRAGAPVQEAVHLLKEKLPELTVITDVCICAYTDHGHCGHIKNGEVDNDSTLETLAKVAVSHAEAGADIVAPSDMMDGRVAAIRTALDESGFTHTPILSYAAKYASAFYGPFRDAAKSAPSKGDRKGYQMDPANRREAMQEIEADINEGASCIIIKPALSYLDVISQARKRFDVPIFAYNVSGEYAMVKAAAARGWIDEKAVISEILTSIKRAGADRIITYFAKEFSVP